jgi:hypothetical protein
MFPKTSINLKNSDKTPLFTAQLYKYGTLYCLASLFFMLQASFGVDFGKQKRVTSISICRPHFPKIGR